LINPEDAEEAVQEALIRAWRTRARGVHVAAPSALAMHITRNEALRVLERRKRLCERETGTERMDEMRDERRHDDVLSDLWFEGALATLEPSDRLLVRLRYEEDLPHPEVARQTGMPEGTVKVRLHRIRHRLRGYVEQGL
jgi:RNA polymerase sigma-70 factor (ECF subfamily)